MVSDLKPPVSGEISAQRKEKKIKENEIKEKEIKDLKCTSTTTKACARENSDLLNSEREETQEITPVVTVSAEEIRERLLGDAKWADSVCRMTGNSENAQKILPGAMRCFENHLVTINESHTILTERNYKRRFTGWWRLMKFKTEEEISAKFQEQPNRQPNGRRLQTVEDVERSIERATKKSLELLNGDFL